MSVERVDGLAALERFSSEIDRLNALSARPSPFSSSAYLRCYALRNEYFRPGLGECLFLVRDGDRLVGCVPMRRRVERWGPSVGRLGIGGLRLEFLALYDNEQPHLLCAPVDEGRVAAALIGHLCRHERGWSMVEFFGQRRGGAFHRCAQAAANARFRARYIEAEPYSEISLTWPDLPSYFASLSSNMRSNLKRRVRRLYAAGDVELVLAQGPGATTAWFNAYCDLDGRSWKRGTRSSIERDPRRVLFFRELLAGRAGLDPWFAGVVLDGVLVAGLIAVADAARLPGRHGAWALEMSYDESRSHLGPGQLLLLLTVGEAIKRGHAFLNLMQGFAYYKRRWQAEPIDVVNVQIIRRRSMHNLRALAGDLKRLCNVVRDTSAGAAAGTPSREKHGAARIEAPVGSWAPTDDKRARRLTATALGYTGTGVYRLDRAAASLYLPFPLSTRPS